MGWLAKRPVYALQGDCISLRTLWLWCSVLLAQLATGFGPSMVKQELGYNDRKKQLGSFDFFWGGLLFVGDTLWGFQRAEAPDVGIKGKCMAWQALHDVFNWAVRPTRNNDFPHRPLWCLCPFFRSLSCKIDVL